MGGLAAQEDRHDALHWAQHKVPIHVPEAERGLRRKDPPKVAAHGAPPARGRGRAPRNERLQRRVGGVLCIAELRVLQARRIARLDDYLHGAGRSAHDRERGGRRLQPLRVEDQPVQPRDQQRHVGEYSHSPEDRGRREAQRVTLCRAAAGPRRAVAVQAAPEQRRAGGGPCGRERLAGDEGLGPGCEGQGVEALGRHPHHVRGVQRRPALGAGAGGARTGEHAGNVAVGVDDAGGQGRAARRPQGRADHRAVGGGRDNLDAAASQDGGIERAAERTERRRGGAAQVARAGGGAVGEDGRRAQAEGRKVAKPGDTAHEGDGRLAEERQLPPGRRVHQPRARRPGPGGRGHVAGPVHQENGGRRGGRAGRRRPKGQGGIHGGGLLLNPQGRRRAGEDSEGLRQGRHGGVKVGRGGELALGVAGAGDGGVDEARAEEQAEPARAGEGEGRDAEVGEGRDTARWPHGARAEEGGARRTEVRRDALREVLACGPAAGADAQPASGADDGLHGERAVDRSLARGCEQLESAVQDVEEVAHDVAGEDGSRAWPEAEAQRDQPRGGANRKVGEGGAAADKRSGLVAEQWTALWVVLNHHGNEGDVRR